MGNRFEAVFVCFQVYSVYRQGAKEETGSDNMTGRSRTANTTTVTTLQVDPNSDGNNDCKMVDAATQTEQVDSDFILYTYGK